MIGRIFLQRARLVTLTDWMLGQASYDTEPPGLVIGPARCDLSWVGQVSELHRLDLQFDQPDVI